MENTIDKNVSRNLYKFNKYSDLLKQNPAKANIYEQKVRYYGHQLQKGGNPDFKREDYPKIHDAPQVEADSKQQAAEHKKVYDDIINSIDNIAKNRQALKDKEAKLLADIEAMKSGQQGKSEEMKKLEDANHHLEQEKQALQTSLLALQASGNVSEQTKTQLAEQAKDIAAKDTQIKEQTEKLHQLEQAQTGLINKDQLQAKESELEQIRKQLSDLEAVAKKMGNDATNQITVIDQKIQSNDKDFATIQAGLKTLSDQPSNTANRPTKVAPPVPINPSPPVVSPAANIIAFNKKTHDLITHIKTARVADTTLPVHKKKIEQKIVELANDKTVNRELRVRGAEQVMNAFNQQYTRKENKIELNVDELANQ